jgi:septal ring factor EnvC (AmiA/AmiB activator)
MDDYSALIERIDSLLQASRNDDDADAVSHMETTLTDGYAQALALEAEHWRLQRQIGEITTELADGREVRTSELAGLARRLSVAQKELETLRNYLASLRDRIAVATQAA